MPCQQVADIKRTNSLLSDSAMFARDSLLIPTRPLPMGCVRLSSTGVIAPNVPNVTQIKV